MLGKLLGGRYKVIKVLGAGGFGQTYVAEDMQRPGNPKCVVKHFKPVNQDTHFLEVGRRLFYGEAAALEKIGQHDRIPRLLAYFEEEREFYLVQELIEGHPLSEELLSGKQFSEGYAINLLKDVLEILEYVHAQGAIHRDIKPSNLIRRDSDGKLVLIDFGAVKAIHTQIAAEPRDRVDVTVGIGTQGYMPSEQMAGKPRFNSDIYALGMIALKALTGVQPYQLPPCPNSGEILWRDLAPVSDEVAIILDRMVCYYFDDRYQSATEVLVAIDRIGSSDSPTLLTYTQQVSPVSIDRKAIFALSSLAVVTLTGFLLFKNLNISSPISELTKAIPIKSKSINSADRISFGTKVLALSQQNKIKKEGVNLIASDDYKQAVITLEKARKINPADPETLIYLNNALIGKGKSYAIAVCVPLGKSPESALEILRGVAQVQWEINSSGGIDGVPLKVAIANDDNEPKIAKNIAEDLVANPEILGAICHGISDTTKAAASSYQAGELVAISPVSSAVQLSGFGGYLFRTMPSDRFTARSLANYMITKLNKQKAVVFFNSNSIYSKSLRNEFKDALFYMGKGKIITEFDLSRPDFNPKRSLKLAIDKGAEVIVLLPSGDVLERALLVVQVNQKRLKMVAGDGFYTPSTLEIGGEEAEGIVLAIPGEITGDRGNKFSTAAKQLWGQEVNWRTALSYDAGKALIAAIDKNPTRKGVHSTLSDPDFSLAGVTGNISFRDTGDREAPVQLVVVTPITPGKPENGYKFQPLN